MDHAVALYSAVAGTKQARSDTECAGGLRKKNYTPRLLLCYFLIFTFMDLNV